MSKKTDKPIQNNLVAKHMGTYNHAKTFDNKKQKSKRGYEKHKGRSYE